MAAPTDEEMRAYLDAQVSSDLLYAWSDSGVSLTTQHALGQRYKTLRVFTSIADSKTDLRETLKTDYRMDSAAGAPVRAEVAKVLASWEMARELSTKEIELKAESKVLGMPRILQHSERQAMVKAVETKYGHFRDAELPSNEYLALKCEECENNEPHAASLDEITARQDATTSSLQSSLDSAGHIRVTKVKAKGKFPTNTEELRRLHRVEAISWLCMASKFKAKHWLHDLEMSSWNKFTEYILGEKVYSLNLFTEASPLRFTPNWCIILNYEHRLRKEAFKLVEKGQATMAEALNRVTTDADLKETYFTTPMALSSTQPQAQPFKYFKGDGKKGGKELGKQTWKGKKGDKGKAFGMYDKGKGAIPLVSSTPDGRELCYAFNAQGCKGTCGRVHACRVKGCYGEHPAREHSKYVKKGQAQEAKSDE